jgi:hypothetical protein
MTSRVRFVSAYFVAAVTACSVLAVQAQKGPALPAVLSAAGDYLIEYSTALGVVSADEEFVQHDLTVGQGALAPPARRLNSDFVFVGLGRGLIATYRDLRTKDGQPLRDHQNRLLETFQKSPVTTAMKEGQQLTDAAAVEYVASNMRMLDDPMLALQFLRKENQDRSTFKLDGVKTIDGTQVAILKFTETATPRLLGAPENAPGTGRFWVDAATGAIRQADLSIGTRNYLLRVSVTFARDPTVKLWLPSESYQQLDFSAGAFGNNNGPGNFSVHQSLEGRARYSKFQQGNLSGR